MRADHRAVSSRKRRPPTRLGHPLPRLSASPKVSCVVTAYNYARFLPQALDSALTQDYPNLEVIVVDDGSTDDTPAVLAAYGDRVTVLRQENAGVVAATSAGITAASGRLITFLDGDDMWPAGRVRALVDALRGAPCAGIAYGDQEVVDAEGRTVSPSLRATGGVPSLSGRLFGRLTERNFISGGAMMVRAELRPLFHPLPSHAGYQDWWIALQASRVADVVSIDDTVNRYRLHGDNANLGAEGERRARLCETEVAFRRWVMRTLEPDVDLNHIHGALRGFDANLGTLSGLRKASPAELLAVTADDRDRAVRALGRASGALDRNELGACLLHLTAAVGHDPLWDEPRALIDQLTPVVGRIAATLAA